MKKEENVRKLFILVVLIACVGCVAYRPQKPSTTLLPPVETDLKKFYDENIDGIMCLSEFLSPQRLVIGIKKFDRQDNGIRVKQIGENSPAENAGLKVGDIITKVNGKPITHPIKIDSPSELEIKRNDKILTVAVVPTLMKTNNAIETKISIEERRGEKYIIEIIVTGIVLNTAQFKTNYERSKWIVSNWATVFWKLNSGCLQERVKTDNITIRFQYSHRNFVTEQYMRGYDEFLEIFSKRLDIVSFAKGDISVQELLDKSMVFINGSREKLLMQ